MAYIELDAPGAEKAQENVGKTERIVSIVSGAFMLVSGITRLKRSPVASITSMITGGALIYRGASGYCAVNEFFGRNSATAGAAKPGALDITEVIRVSRPRNEVYAYWRKLENLPKFMKHLESVKEYDSTRSHWEAKIPGGISTIEWDAKIIHELENETLAWRSDEGAIVANAGEVFFTDAPGQGTIIRVNLSYRPPAGRIGLAITALFNKKFEDMIREDLLGFKHMLESGQLYHLFEKGNEPIR